MPYRVIAATLQTHTHTRTHGHTSPNYSVFLVLLGISQSCCHCQTTSIRPLKPSKPVWFTACLSTSRLPCSLSLSLSHKATSATRLPSQIQDTVLQSAHVHGSCLFVAVVLLQRLLQPQRRAANKEPQVCVSSTGSDSSPEPTRHPHKCQYCWALSSGLAPPLTRGQVNTQSLDSCLGLPLSPALLWRTILKAVISRVQVSILISL